MPSAATVVAPKTNNSQPAGSRGDDEEIGGRDLLEVIRQERAPRLLPRCSRARHVLRDRRLSQFQELAMNPWRSPQGILARHRPNQGADIGRDGRSAEAPATLPGPEQPEALAMPGDDGLWLYDHECRSPIAPRA